MSAVQAKTNPGERSVTTRRDADHLPRRPERTAAFTLLDLLVVVAVVVLLALLPLSAGANAKTKSRQLSCLNNLRQLGVALRLYVADYQQYPGCILTANQTYVWPTRLLKETGVSRTIFSCPAANPNSWWDTNLNKTLVKMRDEYGKIDPYQINTGFADSMGTRFSLGYNDWGISINSASQLGLGGDVDWAAYGAENRPVRDNMVAAPSQMLAIGDTPATQSAYPIYWNANIDPTDNRSPYCQRPSNRHNYRTDLLFTDGHTESPLRNDVISPALNNPWRKRWNNDNQAHNEVVWTLSDTNRLDP